MAAVLFRLTSVPVFDSNGTPVSGALTNFYLTGTLTETPVYSDEALTIEHTNPVEANSAGVLPSIYLSSDITYRVRITDSEGTLIDEADPYRDLSAAEILTKLLTVDGSGSGLDADKVRGTTPGATGLSALAAANAATLLGLILPADGSGSGLDADLVRGTTPGTTGRAILAGASPAAAGLALFARVTINASNRTLGVNDFYIASISGATRDLTIPPQTDAAFSDGHLTFIAAAGGGDLTVTEGAGVTLNWKATSGNRTVASGSHAWLYRRSSNAWDITGGGIS